tara:strand:+ start:18 stop:404 length:387 start_codon:yes stop_codon:yes gene_type:complete
MSEHKLKLKRFLRFYKKFDFHPSWTKEKHNEYSRLQKYLEGCLKIEINSNRDSKTTKVHLTNGFTIFKVPIDQLGKMKELRKKWVLMYCSYKYKFNYTLWVFPLDKGIRKTTSKLLKEEFENIYIENV